MEGVRQDVRCYMYADVHCRGFGSVPAQENLFGKQIFSLFLAERLQNAKSKEFCQQHSSTRRGNQDREFLEFTAKNISAVFCEREKNR